MSDAQHRHIQDRTIPNHAVLNHAVDDNVSTLVRLCGFSPEHARAELTAFSHREKAGLIPAARALEVLKATASAAEDAATDNQRRWREILRGPGGRHYALAA